MKYRNEVKIRLPREKVVRLFDSEENLFKWQPDLISFEHISGDKGEVGAKAKLKYKMGKREIEMIETITVKNLPKEFSGTYEARGVWNKQVNSFEVIDEHSTRWTSVSEFRCSGFMKIMCWLMPGAFKKQTLKLMNHFKEFAEGR